MTTRPSSPSESSSSGPAKTRAFSRSVESAFASPCVVESVARDRCLTENCRSRILRFDQNDERQATEIGKLLSSGVRSDNLLAGVLFPPFAGQRVDLRTHRDDGAAIPESQSRRPHHRRSRQKKGRRPPALGEWCGAGCPLVRTSRLRCGEGRRWISFPWNCQGSLQGACK